MTNKFSIKKLLQQYHLRPSKRLGQHFLISQKALQKIIQTAELSKEDIVLEIGPGLGVLTEQLAQSAKKVMAIEKDKKIAEALKDILKDYPNIKIIRDDILKIRELPSIRYKLVANIPYYLTSPLIRLFLEAEKPPQLIVLLIQKEVAQRICAQPPQMSLLAIAVQFYGRPQIIRYISKKSFWPPPKVDSAIIKIVPHRPVIASQETRKKFFQMVKTGFSWPRKQLANNLAQKLNLDRQKIKKALTECRLDTQVRAEHLSLDDWQKLTSILTDDNHQ